MLKNYTSKILKTGSCPMYLKARKAKKMGHFLASKGFMGQRAFDPTATKMSPFLSQKCASRGSYFPRICLT